MPGARLLVALLVVAARAAAADPQPLCAEASGARCTLAAAWRDWAAADPLRQQLLGYAVKCALPEGFEVEAAGRALRGGFGLRPEWRASPLALDGQEIVSACLLGLVNAFGEHVTVAIAGPDVPFRAPPRFRYQEGAFFGNVFASPAARAACRGAGGGDAVGKDRRICTLDGARCGIDVVGACWRAGCVRWAGVAPHIYCAEARDRAGRVYQHPITFYLEAR